MHCKVESYILKRTKQEYFKCVSFGQIQMNLD